MKHEVYKIVIPSLPRSPQTSLGGMHVFTKGFIAHLDDLGIQYYCLVQRTRHLKQYTCLISHRNDDKISYMLLGKKAIPWYDILEDAKAIQNMLK